MLMLVDAIKMLFVIALRKVLHFIFIQVVSTCMLHSSFFLEIVSKKHVLKCVNVKMYYR